MKNIIKLIPESLLVKLYKKLPMPLSVRKKIIWHGNRRFLVSVQGLIFNDKNQILLLKHTYRKIPWGIPGGWLDYEEPIVGLIREVHEETNFHISISGVIKTEYITTPNSINIVYRGQFIDGEFAPNSEISECRFFDKDDLPNELPERQKNLISDYYRDNLANI